MPAESTGSGGAVWCGWWRDGQRRHAGRQAGRQARRVRRRGGGRGMAVYKGRHVCPGRGGEQLRQETEEKRSAIGKEKDQLSGSYHHTSHHIASHHV